METFFAFGTTGVKSAQYMLQEPLAKAVQVSKDLFMFRNTQVARRGCGTLVAISVPFTQKNFTRMMKLLRTQQFKVVNPDDPEQFLEITLAPTPVEMEKILAFRLLAAPEEAEEELPKAAMELRIVEGALMQADPGRIQLIPLNPRMDFVRTPDGGEEGGRSGGQECSGIASAAGDETAVAEMISATAKLDTEGARVSYSERGVRQEQVELVEREGGTCGQEEARGGRREARSGGQAEEGLPKTHNYVTLSSNAAQGQVSTLTCPPLTWQTRNEELERGGEVSGVMTKRQGELDEDQPGRAEHAEEWWRKEAEETVWRTLHRLDTWAPIVEGVWLWRPMEHLRAWGFDARACGGGRRK